MRRPSLRELALTLAVSTTTPAAQGGGPVVAALQGGRDRAAFAPGCGDAPCVMDEAVRRAAAAGASLVVLPEYFFDVVEPDPEVGAAPPIEAPVQRRASLLAAEHRLYLVIDLLTNREGQAFNTQVALGPDGRVVARHHKFELYEGERRSLTAGDDVVAFDTPFGRVGLLICADIYGDPRLHRKLVEELGVQLVAFSAQWTVADATRWPEAFARDWGVTVVAANRSAGEGKGGGVFTPHGPRAVSRRGATALVTAPIR